MSIFQFLATVYLIIIDPFCFVKELFFPIINIGIVHYYKIIDKQLIVLKINNFQHIKHYCILYRVIASEASFLVCSMHGFSIISRTSCRKCSKINVSTCI